MIKIFFLFCFFFCPAIASAMEGPESATHCHCFQDRAFDPQKKFAADSYLLTTNFNSFIAAKFHISKSQIVMMKMKGGVEPDDLLIALYVAQVGRVELNSLLGILDNGGTWKQILESESMLKRERRENMVVDPLVIDDNKEAAAERVTDQLLKEYFKISEKDITILRKEGANGREITLLFNLERYGKRKKSAAEILSMYREQQMSWGEIAHSFGLSPKETGKLFLSGESSPGIE